MSIDADVVIRRAVAEGDAWQSWRALRLRGEAPREAPQIPSQHEEGGFIGPTGRPSPGATGEGLCHLKILGLTDSGAAAIAGDFLHESRTPAEAWLDSPDDVAGELDGAAGSRVWATASAACGLLAIGLDPGERAFMLLRGEADPEGRFTGGAYPTFAAAGAWWLREGERTEMAEWALRWVREWTEDWWGPWERATALTFWAAAGIPPENPTVERFLDDLSDEAPSDGWPDDLGLTLRTLEVAHHFNSA
ncbi:MAG: hypothetical protein H0U53_09980 [Actinobacteria bacterium]|nr:hypothetical protein [Actinomycetota bacterium]